MKVRLIAAALVFVPVVAFAQAPQAPQLPPADRYWQQLLSNKESQSSEQIVQLARQVDALQAQIAELQKENAELKKAKVAPTPEKKP